MPRASVNQNPQHVAKIGYSGFDMSQELNFTSPPGMLLPVYYDILSPGDKVDCRAIIRTRTQPMETAATMELLEHVEWFFVPLQQIYQPFGNFFYGVDDYSSSVFAPFASNPKEISQLPYGNMFGTIGDDMWSAFKSTTGLHGYSAVGGFLRLAELLGCPISGNIVYTWDTTIGNFPISPLLFCAYQKIFSDFYRLSQRTPNEPASYNIDDFVVNQQYNISVTDFVARFGQLRYRPWKRDFFKGNQVSPLMGDQSVGAQVSQNNDLLREVNQWLSGLSGITPISPGSSANFPDGGVGSPDPVKPTTLKVETSSGTTNVNQAGMRVYMSSLNPANIRTLFASEKLLEITRRAGKHYDAQTLAHFGVKVPQGVDGEVIYLGEQTAKINVGDVISQAATTNAPLGEIAGKGYAYGSGDSCKFEAKTHGILMAIYSAEPSAKYYQIGIDKLVSTTSRTDFVIPEYDDLGMQPIFRYQSDFGDDPTTNALVDGWHWRYQEYKQKYDRVCGGFGDAQSQKHWVNGFNPYILQTANYYIRPDALNGVMLYNFDMAKHDDASSLGVYINDYLYSSDPLLHFLYFDVKKSSKMSVYGIPSL